MDYIKYNYINAILGVTKKHTAIAFERFNLEASEIPCCICYLESLGFFFSSLFLF